MYRLIHHISVILFLVLLLCAICYAEDGRTGHTSTGTSNITIVIPPRLNPVTNPATGQVKMDTNLNLNEYDKIIVSDDGKTQVVIYIPKS